MITYVRYFMKIFIEFTERYVISIENYVNIPQGVKSIVGKTMEMKDY